MALDTKTIKEELPDKDVALYETNSSRRIKGKGQIDCCGKQLGLETQAIVGVLNSIKCCLYFLMVSSWRP